MEDSKIIDLFWQRDESALVETASKYGLRLRNLSYRVVQNYQTAEECENSTYLEAWKRIPPHEPRTYLFAFLAKIIRNLSLNRCRDDSRLKRSAVICELSEEMEQCIPSPSDVECQIDDLMFQEALNDFLTGLSQEKRMVFLRRYWFMDSIAEISASFFLSESKVKTTLFRCRKELKEYLEKEGYHL